MSSLLPYISFPGTCKDALQYYAEIFNADIVSMTTFGESPIPVDDQDRNRIYNSELVSDLVHFKASDDLPQYPVKVGSNISLFIAFEDRSLRQQIFEKLTEEGKVLFPLDEAFGMLRDRYDIQWMLTAAH
ncbi:MAG: VOC family protein [Bacteroidota bacterium]